MIETDHLLPAQILPSSARSFSVVRL